MSAFHPLQTRDTHQWLAGAKEHEHMVVHALGQLACVELIAGLAREETPAPEPMDVEASAARIFNEKAVLVRTHKPAPLRTIRHSTVEQ
jgi:hypothetical protein